MTVIVAGLSPRSFNYCVTGDELRLEEENGPVMTLERVYPVANPVACAMRSVENCELGEDPGEGCRIGACTGGDNCTSATLEPNCTNRQGCTWDKTVCAGNAATCQLHQLGKTPGCDLRGEQLRCTGTRMPCAGLPAATCNDAPGCSFGVGCSGGSVNCTALAGACSFCSNVDGCGACPESGNRCEGMSTCSAQRSQAACERVESYGMGSCEWGASLCRGTPIPCEQLGVERCEDAAGCELVPVEE